MKKSHRQILKDYLQYLWLQDPSDGWVEGFKLQNKELNGEWSSHMAGVRLREMFKNNEVERSYRDGYAIYRHKPTEDEQDLIQEKQQALENRQLSNQVSLF